MSEASFKYLKVACSALIMFVGLYHGIEIAGIILVIIKTRSQAVARIVDRAASQQTIYSN